jgi:hypothetical protein
VSRNKKGVNKVTTVTLESLEKRIVKNSSKNSDRVKSFEDKLGQRYMRSGRVRPRNSTESKILSMFKRK